MKQNTKIQNLRSVIQSYGKVAVCLSGGVDSCTLLKFSSEILGSDNVLAIVGSAEYMIVEEMDFAKKLCEKLGVRLVSIDVSVAEIISANPPERCYICKRKIFSTAKKIAESFGIYKVVDGTNYDDLNEVRLGMLAKKEFCIESPFADCKISKNLIRELAKSLSLEECSRKVSATCLMTRFPVGAKASREDFVAIEKVEAFVKSLGFDLVRARVCGDTIIIEVECSRVSELTSHKNMAILKDYFVKEIKKDFKISEQGYKLGFV